MPLYEYSCPRCQRPFEKYARTFNEKPDCPTCGATTVTRLLSTFAVGSNTSGARGAAEAAFGGCGEGPPCGAAQCGRLPN